MTNLNKIMSEEEFALKKAGTDSVPTDLIRNGVILKDGFDFIIKSWNPGYGFDVEVTLDTNIAYDDAELRVYVFKNENDKKVIHKAWINDYRYDGYRDVVEETIKVFEEGPGICSNAEEFFGTTNSSALKNFRWSDDVLNIV